VDVDAPAFLYIKLDFMASLDLDDRFVCIALSNALLARKRRPYRCALVLVLGSGLYTLYTARLCVMHVLRVIDRPWGLG